MQKLVSVLTKVSKVKKDDDFADRLSHRYTVSILVVCAIVVSTALYVGKPITCWVPKHFTGSHTKYANNYCWVKNTYYLPMDVHVPFEHEGDRMKKEIIYYQWMPFILLLQAVFFYLPTVVWHEMNQKAGVDCDNILACATTMEKIEKASKRDQTLGLLTKQMDRFLTSRIDRGATTVGLRSFLTKTLLCCCGRRLGNYLAILFTFSKILYIGNVIAQLFLLNLVLKTTYNLFGFEFWDNVTTEDGYWTNSDIFPRVTMCDFKVRRLGNVQRYTVQCVLPINMYTEKIFTFLWFWMVFVALVSVCNALTWIVRFFLPSDSVKYLRNHLSDGDREIDQKLLDDFVKGYLKTDGVFIFRLISHNTNYITSTEVIRGVWKYWLDNHAQLPPTTEEDPTLDPEKEKLRESKDF